MSILIVEDNRVNAITLEAILQKAGYETAVVPDAKSALTHLTTASYVEVIITDIIMPEMDGLELLHRIKERPEWKDIPVIMCSGLSDLETVKKALKAGCSNFLIKPVEGRDLLKKVREALKEKRAILNTKKAMTMRLGLEEEGYERIAAAFSAMINDTIGKLEGQVVGESAPMKIDLAELNENAAHFGAERLRDVVRKMLSGELSLGTEKDDSGCRLLIRELRLVQHALESHTPKEKGAGQPRRSAKSTAKKPKRAAKKIRKNA